MNARLLSEFSQERQTLTIMHEILHGYLTYDNDVNLNLSIPNQHTKMLNNYIGQMASLLENIFPNLKSTPWLALALCFDNLESSVARSKGISFFNKISLNDFIDALKNNGFDNISSYQSIANKAKSSDSLLGTPCSN